MVLIYKERELNKLGQVTWSKINKSPLCLCAKICWLTLARCSKLAYITGVQCYFGLVHKLSGFKLYAVIFIFVSVGSKEVISVQIVKFE